MPRIEVGTAKVEVQVASAPEQRRRGLAGVRELPPDTGMLFVFDKPDRHPFTMRGMLIPLDVVWISAEQEVVDVTANVPPDRPGDFTSRVPAQYVLEVPAGFVAQHGVSVGDGVTL